MTDVILWTAETCCRLKCVLSFLDHRSKLLSAEIHMDPWALPLSFTKSLLFLLYHRPGEVKAIYRKPLNDSAESVSEGWRTKWRLFKYLGCYISAGAEEWPAVFLLSVKETGKSILHPISAVYISLKSRHRMDYRSEHRFSQNVALLKNKSGKMTT